jgi:hypothetical protein
MAKKSCKKGYYYCFTSKKCKKIPSGWHVMPSTGYLMRDSEHKDEKEETKKKNGNGANGNGNGNGDSSGGSDGGGVSEGWSAKYKKSIDCDNPKGFSQRAHCQGRKKVNEATMSPAQKRKDTMLKKKYDKSDMKQNMIDQYGKEEGTKIYFATIRKQAMKEEKKGDHEISMAQSQLKKSERNIKKLRKALGTKERDIPAWVQAKITDTEHNTDAAAGYMEEGKRDGKSAKSKGYSLRDWFKGGGWVQAGGKYDGKPCAKQPGQKTKPFCRDADDRASMSKDERERRAKKKRKEDPNPNRKGKAKMVSEQSGGGWMQVGGKTVNLGNSRYHHPDSSTYTPPSLPRPTTGSVPPPVTLRSNTPTPRRTSTRTASQSRAQSNSGAITYTNNDKLRQAQKDAADVGRMTGTSGLMRSATQSSNRMQSRYDQLRNAMRQAGMKGADQNMNMRGVPMRNSYKPEGELIDEKAVKMPDHSVKGSKAVKMPDHSVKGSKAVKMPDHSVKIDEGKKDACYHKVKSRYSVWPSAYASGALVKCRKVGAKNWGNKTKKEGYEFSNWRDNFQATEYESVDIIKAEPLKPTDGIGSRMLGEAKKCWKGYKKAGTQKLFGKTYNRCVKAHFSDWRAEMDLQEKKAKKDYDGDGKIESGKDEYMGSRDKAIKKAIAMKEDWQKSNRKDGVDGMSQKSVNAYKRENPGSKLQTAVTEKKPTGKRAKRRTSFCARSKGQKDMHNIDCTKTPDKKICKARKRWRC